MGVCFLCDTKLFGERTRVCSSITPHSNVPYPEKIAELLGDEFVVVVTPADHMCKKCTSLLTHMDKLENDLKLVKNAMLSYIQKKYGILPSDQSVKGVDVVNGHLKTDELEVGQKKVPSGLTAVRDNPPTHTPMKMLKTPADSSKLKIYKCGFCTFQSKELGHVRFHMRSHMNKKGEEKAIQPAAPKVSAQTPQKKRLYRCQVCSTSFDSRMDCLEHIQKDHNSAAASTSANEKESGEISSTTKLDKLMPEDNEQTETAIAADGDDGQHDKGTVDADMMLNDNLSAEATEATGEQDVHNMGEGSGTQDDPLTLPDDEPMEVNNDVEKEVDGKITNGSEENKAGDLDIESMLAAIHHDDPSTSEDTQNVA